MTAITSQDSPKLYLPRITMPRLNFILLIVIFIEGYVVLSSELLAMRLAMPFVGRGTETTAIIVAGVLLPLAFGYNSGGRYKPGLGELSVRHKLNSNVLWSMVFLVFGTSYSFVQYVFGNLGHQGIQNPIIQTTLYVCFFLIIPIYLLGQTAPLVSHYFRKRSVSVATSQIMAVSTVGSFLGAVFSTIVLMATIGVHGTANINMFLLGAIVILLSRKSSIAKSAVAIVICTFSLIVNSDSMLSVYGIVENNQHNTIQVVKNDEGRELLINNNHSAYMTDMGQAHDYINFMEKLTGVADLDRISSEVSRNILVLGAGGFTYGAKNNFDKIHYVDIDENLKQVAEQHLLNGELSSNKTFDALPGRGFLNQTSDDYDVIIVDMFTGRSAPPDHLVTQEFFLQVKSRLKLGGAFVANYITSSTLKDVYSKRLDKTIRSVFPWLTRHVVNRSDHPYADRHVDGNVVYEYWHHEENEENEENEEMEDLDIYSDIRPDVFLDNLQ